MANKNYYYNLYKQKRNAVKSYDNELADLRKILSNLTDTMSDEIRDINNELEDLKSDLLKSIRHNNTFTSRANIVTAEKEKAVTADPNLRIAVNMLEDEITRLNNLRTTAINERDNYYSRYTEKKEEERQERLRKFF